MTAQPSLRRQPTARQKVEAKYPNAFGWREFSTSDYTIHTGTGRVIGKAHSAVAAWAQAARLVEQENSNGR